MRTQDLTNDLEGEASKTDHLQEAVDNPLCFTLHSLRSSTNDATVVAEGEVEVELDPIRNMAEKANGEVKLDPSRNMAAKATDVYRLSKIAIHATRVASDTEEKTDIDPSRNMAAKAMEISLTIKITATTGNEEKP